MYYWLSKWVNYKQGGGAAIAVVADATVILSPVVYAPDYLWIVYPVVEIYTNNKHN